MTQPHSFIPKGSPTPRASHSKYCGSDPCQHTHAGFRKGATLDIVSAREAIEAILAAIPDEELPTFDRVETSKDGKIVAWHGGTGRVLGSATSGGQRDPSVYRRNASWEAIQLEMTYRADRKLLENGDDPRRVTIAGKP